MDNLLVEALEKIATTCFNLGHAEEVARKALSQYNALPGSQVGEEIKIIKRGIHHVIAESEGLGYWHTCSGCHESEDGHDVGEYYYSETFKCKLGGGCHECGGIGAIWEYHEKEFQIDSSIEESGLKEGEEKNLGTCVECKKRKAVRDYNGHGHFVCNPCYDSLSNEFEDEYR